MSQQSDMAKVVYGLLDERQVSAAELVRELRQRWGADHKTIAIHFFICEAAYCFMDQDDVEIGHIEAGQFVPWHMDPLDAYERFENEFTEIATDHDDDARYVFRKITPPAALRKSA